METEETHSLAASLEAIAQWLAEEASKTADPRMTLENVRRVQLTIETDPLWSVLLGGVYDRAAAMVMPVHAKGALC